MEHEEFKSENYCSKIELESIKEEALAYLKDIDYSEELEKEENKRGGVVFFPPTNISFPFISLHFTHTEHGIKEDVNMGWAKLDENGEIPKSVSSATAHRDDGKPAIISFTKLGDEITIKEVLFSAEHGFERYVFDHKGVLDHKWFYLKNKSIKKIYEINCPMYINYYKDGNPKEVWFSNPNATSFVETSCTYRMIDDHPVVISFYDNGDIEKVDYTGYTFADKNVPHSVENFPFSSRYRFYMPSYYHYGKRNEAGKQPLIMKKYFIRKEDVSEYDVLGMIESWGVDASDPDEVKIILEENPIFEKTIRQTFGIGVIRDEQLDETIMLHSLKMD